MAMSRELRIQMLKRGVTQRSIAKELGVSHECVWGVFEGDRKNPVVRAAIVKAVGWSEKKIWPNDKPRGPRVFLGRVPREKATAKKVA